MASNGSELRAFLAFLGNLWAVLAQASVLFPYASSFLALVPIRPMDGDPSFPFYYLPPAIVPLMATLVCTYTVLALFNRRSELPGPGDRVRPHQRSGWLLGAGLAALVCYLALRGIDVGALMSDLGVGDLLNLKRAIKLGVDVVMLGCYVLFFRFVTAAFMLEGLRAYRSGSGGS
jgi:hypothetical protein